jgi:hypothetical protein
MSDENVKALRTYIRANDDFLSGFLDEYGPDLLKLSGDTLEVAWRDGMRSPKALNWLRFHASRYTDRQIGIIEVTSPNAHSSPGDEPADDAGTKECGSRHRAEEPIGAGEASKASDGSPRDEGAGFDPGANPDSARGEEREAGDEWIDFERIKSVRPGACAQLAPPVVSRRSPGRSRV